MGPETKFTILLYQYCKWNARRTHPKEGLRAFAFLISVYKTAGLGCTLGHQIMSCILPLGRGIILRFELFQGLTNALTAAQQSQIREIETAYKLLEIFQETLFICHSTHHLESCLLYTSVQRWAGVTANYLHQFWRKVWAEDQGCPAVCALYGRGIQRFLDGP